MKDRVFTGNSILTLCDERAVVKLKVAPCLAQCYADIKLKQILFKNYSMAVTGLNHFQIGVYCLG